MHDPSRVNVAGPLEPFAAGFADWLARHGYTPISATFQLRLMARLSCSLTTEGIAPRTLSMMDLAVSRCAAARWVQARGARFDPGLVVR